MLDPEPQAGAAVSDSHAHLGHIVQWLGQDRTRAVLDAYEASDSAFILDIGTRPGDLGERIGAFGAWSRVRFSAGLWPGAESLENPNAALFALEKDLKSGACSALGECGLDYHHMEAEPARQKSLFRSQALLAVEYGLPLIVHSRDAYLDTLEVVAETASYIPVVIHCFGYGPREAEKFLEAGCRLSFAGNLSYKGAGALREAFLACPLDRLLLETDAPYMNPLPFRGKPSTSLDILRTLGLGAVLRNMETDDLARKLSGNADELFPMKGRGGFRAGGAKEGL